MKSYGHLLGSIDMESEFAAAIARWQNFESLAGSVAATLLGLLFVAVSIRPALFGQETHPAYLAVATKESDLMKRRSFLRATAALGMGSVMAQVPGSPRQATGQG